MLTPRPLASPSVGEVVSHARATARLALPIIVARAGWMFMSFVDILMVGRYATDELAYMSLASSLISVAYVPMMGMMLGTLVLASNLFGQRRYSRIGAVWRCSLPLAFGLGLLLAILTFFAEPLLLLGGQTPTLAREAGAVIRIYGYGMPLGGLLFVTSQYFLEGIKRPLPAMVLMLTGNVVNVGLNWVLIYGHLGFEAMGASGSAWGTTIIRMLITAAIIYYILNMPGARLLGVRRPYRDGFRAWREQRRLGYAAGISYGVEHASFVMLFMFAGLLGTLDLAAVTIVFNSFALFFMVAAGISSATAVQVGIAWGQSSARRIAISGWTGWGLLLLTLTLPAVLMVKTPAWFARLYTADAAVLALAQPMYVLAGLALLLDTTQTLWANALRGRHDKWLPTVSHLISYIALMVPLSYYLAFIRGHRGEGLFEALIVASLVSVALQIARFVQLSRRDRRSVGGLSGVIRGG